MPKENSLDDVAAPHRELQGVSAPSAKEHAPETPARSAFPFIRPAIVTPLPVAYAHASSDIVTSAPTSPLLLQSKRGAMAPVETAPDAGTAPLAPGQPFYALWAVKDPGTTAPPTGKDLRKWTVHQLRKQCAEYETHQQKW